MPASATSQEQRATSLQQEYGLSRDTVRHALRLLREAGLVVTVRGKGTYVAVG
ncbi:GntR family transcriptional regulator [Winogradskya humida]|uniref:GntR family transcriptional regulator n=1 Tax=Winogradskya humida TaxID=113566 RepID=UPI001943A453|nr:GntR family transcriptional regulator [Actinoplanes humidus]